MLSSGFSKLVAVGLLSTTLTFTLDASRFDADAPFGEGNVPRVLQGQPGIDVMRAFVMLSDTEAEREQRYALLDRVGSTSLLRSGLDVHAIWCGLVVAIPNVAQRIFALSHIPLAEATAMDGAALVIRMIDIKRADPAIAMWTNVPAWVPAFRAEVVAMRIPNAELIADAIAHYFRTPEDAMIVLNGGQIDEGSACAGVSEYAGLDQVDLDFIIARIAGGNGPILSRVASADALRMYCARSGAAPREFEDRFVAAMERLVMEHRDGNYRQVLAAGAQLEDSAKILMLEWAERHGFGDMQDMPRAREWARGKQAELAALPGRADHVGHRPFGGSYAPLAWAYMRDRIAALEYRDLPIRLNLNGLYFDNGLGFADDFEPVSYADFERYITEWINGIPAVDIVVDRGVSLNAARCIESLLHGGLREMNTQDPVIAGLRAQLLRYIDLLRERNRNEAQAMHAAGGAAPAAGFNMHDAERQTLAEIINMTHRRCAFGTMAFLEEWYPKKNFRPMVEADPLLRKIAIAVQSRAVSVLYGHTNVDPEREGGNERAFFRPEFVLMQNVMNPMLGYRFPVRDVHERTHMLQDMGLNNGTPAERGNTVEAVWDHLLNGWQRPAGVVGWVRQVAVDVAPLRTARDLIALIRALPGEAAVMSDLNDYLRGNPLYHMMFSNAMLDLYDTVFQEIDNPNDMKDFSYLYVLHKLGMVRFPMADAYVEVSLASERVRQLVDPSEARLLEELDAARFLLGGDNDPALNALAANITKDGLADGLIAFLDRKVQEFLDLESGVVEADLAQIAADNARRERVVAPELPAEIRRINVHALPWPQ